MKKSMYYTDWRLIAIINCVSFIALFCMTWIFGIGPTIDHAILQAQEHEVLSALSFFISFFIGPMGIAQVLWGLMLRPFLALMKLCGGHVDE